MQTLTLKLQPDLSGWLDERARKLNRSKSDIAREALETQRRSQGGDSVTARAAELVGGFASHRKDSSHKRHLKGFGR